MQKFLAEKFVAVWIDDKKTDQFAAKLGLSQEGYPNIAMYDAGGDYLGRVIGFGGRDPWWKDVEGTWKTGEALTEARAAAEKDPALWVDYATKLAAINGREKDAMAALERVPQDKRGKDYEAARDAFGAKAAWLEAEKALRATTKDAKNVDDMKAAAPKGLALVDGWIKEHGGKNAKVDPVALAKKGGLLVLLARTSEAIEIAVRILHDWPDSPQATAILRGLR